MVSAEFKQNVQSGDVDTVRSALIDYLIIDRSFKRFNEALAYAKQSLDVLQKYDGEPFEVNPDKWDIAYLNRQKAELMFNFSKERIQHIQDVIAKVLPAEKREISNNTPIHRVNPSKRNTKTGRTKISETRISHEVQESTRRHTSVFQKNKRHRFEQRKHQNNQSKRTGRRVIDETPSGADRTEQKSKEDGAGTAMIIGGIAIAAVGMAVTEPIAIGTGVIITGIGAGLKIHSKQ